MILKLDRQTEQCSDLAELLLSAFDGDSVSTILQRLKAGDSGCLEIHVQFGKPKTVRLRDWSLGKQTAS